MQVPSISPSFQSDLTSKVKYGIHKTIADPTDVNNPDAAISGVVAAGGVSGAAVVASKLRTMRNAATTGQKYIKKVVSLKAKNVSILADFAAKMSKFFRGSKATSWISRAMESAVGRKTIGGAIGLGALGITAAQLYSAGDMAMEAYSTYKS